MTAAVLRSINVDSLPRLGWLPAGGQGNDLDDHAWAPVLELCDGDVPAVLAALRAASVPAYAAPAHIAGAGPHSRGTGDHDWQLWVGTSAYGTAEAVLLTVMPALTHRRGNRGDHA